MLKLPAVYLRHRLDEKAAQVGHQDHALLSGIEAAGCRHGLNQLLHVQAVRGGQISPEPGQGQVLAVQRVHHATNDMLLLCRHDDSVLVAPVGQRMGAGVGSAKQGHHLLLNGTDGVLEDPKLLPNLLRLRPEQTEAAGRPSDERYERPPQGIHGHTGGQQLELTNGPSNEGLTLQRIHGVEKPARSDRASPTQLRAARALELARTRTAQAFAVLLVLLLTIPL